MVKGIRLETNLSCMPSGTSVHLAQCMHCTALGTLKLGQAPGLLRVAYALPCQNVHHLPPPQCQAICIQRTVSKTVYAAAIVHAILLQTSPDLLLTCAMKLEVCSSMQTGWLFKLRVLAPF